MRECANDGCTDGVDVLVPFVEPVELMAYCKRCGIYEYQSSPKAQGVFDADADLTALLGDLPDSIDIADIDGFETMDERLDVESGPVKRYHDADPSDDDATRTVSGMVRTGPDESDVHRIEYVLDDDADELVDAVRYGMGKSASLTPAEEHDIYDAVDEEDDDAP